MSEKPKRSVPNLTEDLKQLVLNKILDNENFNSCFEGIHIPVARLLRLKARINESVISAFLKELGEVLEEAEVVKKFELLNSIEPIPGLCWRPPGDPVAHLRSYRSLFKRRQLEELNKLIKIKTDNISKLKTTLTSFMESVRSLMIKKEQIEKMSDSTAALAMENKKLLDDLNSELAQSVELIYFNRLI